MKYIRTKDKIMCCEHTLSQEEIDLYASNRTPLPYPFETLNQADTIEGLCDFVYVEYKDNCFETYDLKGADKYLKDLNKTLLRMWENIVVVYYGIITNKGLIYVAKMNEKGELKLL